jgi:hypothetical protein
MTLYICAMRKVRPASLHNSLISPFLTHLACHSSNI